MLPRFDDTDPEAASYPELPEQSLEERLASVMEGEGISINAGDGILLIGRPTNVTVPGAVKRRRRRRRARSERPSFARPAVSTPESDNGRDVVADLDRVIVGFAKQRKSEQKRMPVSVRYMEHARSPFVISLRSITFYSGTPAPDERVFLSDMLRYEPAPSERPPSLDVLESLARDLRLNGDIEERYSLQFTPASFSSAYRMSYGPLIHALNRVESGIRDATSLFRRRHSRVTALQDGEVFVEPAWSPLRAVAGVGMLLLIATLPANAVRLSRAFDAKKAAVTEAGELALSDMASLRESTDLDASIATLRKTSERFRAADRLLSETNTIATGLSSLLPATRSNYRTARALLEIGSSSADAARLLATGLSAAVEDSSRSALDRLTVFATYANGALPLLDRAVQSLANVDESVLPESEREKLNALSEGIQNGRVAVREFVGLSEFLRDLLGETEPRRYVIVFQNPHELRPTGGFMGSYAELDLSRGNIKRLNIPGGGTYDLQGQLLAQVIPPKPLSLVAERWEFQDSNWSPDFPAAAEKMRFFWSKSGGYTVDGIIAVNATLIEDLLDFTGPIDIPELDKVIDRENFMLETQKAVELEYDRAENQPKKILGLMAPKLMEKLTALPPAEKLRLLGMLSGAITRKDVQIALTDPQKNEFAQQFGWSGRLKPSVGDELAVIAANIAGQKTDAVIREDVRHDVRISEEGGIADTVTVTRQHNASPGELFRGVRNVAYFRFYVPRGSSLLSADGFAEPAAAFFDEPREDAVPDPDIAAAEKTKLRHPSGVEIWDEGDRTVIGGWSMVDPGKTVTLVVTYRLPFTAFDIRERLRGSLEDGADTGARAAYSLLLTSQSGKPDRRIETRVAIPETWGVQWSRDGEGIADMWDRDRVLSALYSTKQQ